MAFWDKEKQDVELSIVSTKVATGEENNPGHFITPVGWYEQTVEHGTFRAQGTKNEKGILGYGKKGMRIWDFGWQKAETGWLKKPEVATDPYSLEQRLGKPDSKGCVRISAELNKFIDLNGILDFNFNSKSPKYFALDPNRKLYQNQGSFILVI